ncbi:MAG: hypothetical protein NTY19_04810 [Planctomycetota bacterium]|nr:hypothetical protein [Planctomycetota bacterium]
MAILKTRTAPVLVARQAAADEFKFGANKKQAAPKKAKSGTSNASKGGGSSGGSTGAVDTTDYGEF